MTHTLRQGRLTLHGCGPDASAGARTWIAEGTGGGPVGEFRTELRVANARRAGLALTRPWTGEGQLLRDALRLLVDHLQYGCGLHRVDIDALDTEQDVIAAARGCGFSAEGRRRHVAIRDGRWHDRLHFGLLEDDRRQGHLTSDAPDEHAEGAPVLPSPPIPALAPADFAVLRGARVTLRRRRASDRDTFYRWQCRSEWWPLWMPEDPDGYRAPSRTEFDASWSDAPSAREWVVETENGLPLGVCFYCALDRANRSAEADVLLYDADQWGQGYGTEAFGLLVRHLFEDLKLHRVQSGTWSGNAGSLRVQVKNGLRVEALSPDSYFVGGQWYDGVGTGVLEDECAARGPREGAV